MIELSRRTILIENHPFFSRFHKEDVVELAHLGTEKSFQSGETIVAEGDLIDAVYLIHAGEIEVEVNGVPRQLLREGESIGLTTSGFYSGTGLRTATLKAAQEVILLGWKLDIFHRFLGRHHEIQETMKEASETMLRANFIKQAAPFAEIPDSATIDLASKIIEVEVPSGTVLFTQGEKANECYLLVSGEVQIEMLDPKGQPNIVATIESGQLFGESAVLGNPERSASARVTKDSRLLLLKAHHVHHLMRHPHALEAIMGLVVKHWRPKKILGIQHFKRISDEGANVIILKDKNRGRYYQLSEDGWFVWQLIDGIKNLQDITIELYKAHRFYPPQAVADMILEMAESGFVVLPEFRPEEKQTVAENLTSWQSIKQKLRSLRYLSWVDNNVDHRFAHAYQTVVRFLYTVPAQIILAITALAGAALFCAFLAELPSRMPTTLELILGFMAAFAAHILSTFFHELSHGFTVKYFGYDVHRAGFIFAWTGMVAYVDTSDMWLSPRRSRVIVSLAGPYFDLVIAGLSSIIAFLLNSTPVGFFFWFFALILYYSVIKNLNPNRENDGYIALKDLLKAPNLHADAIAWLRGSRLDTPKSSRVSILYWTIYGLFLVINVVIAIIAQHYLRLMLPENIFGASSWHLLWLLPALVIVKFIITLLRQIKNSQSASDKA